MPVAVVMAAVLTSGPTGCLLIASSTPPLQSQNVQSREKATANHEAQGVTVCVCVCVCVFIKLHITTQSGLVILVILCHSH